MAWVAPGARADPRAPFGLPIRRRRGNRPLLGAATSYDAAPAGALCVHVAEEGQYGFSIVVKNGLGVSSPAPATGDAPQLWVTVDETAPSVQVTECCVGHGDCLVIGWTASDAHLANDPITIST